MSNYATFDLNDNTPTSLTIDNTTTNHTNDNFYYTNKNIGAGRGFGNLEVSNEIRYGDASRANTKEYKEEKESKQIFEYQFQYLDKNFQDPEHIVMPIPRGGEITRKQNQLVINTMRHNTTNYDEINKTIKFNYN
jgi:predicted enzyme involved in methoxymalonyl-ACP biosynthesis